MQHVNDPHVDSVDITELAHLLTLGSFDGRGRELAEILNVDPSAVDSLASASLAAAVRGGNPALAAANAAEGLLLTPGAATLAQSAFDAYTHHCRRCLRANAQERGDVSVDDGRTSL